MDKLPSAEVLPDGSLRVPRETRELLYRVLGDVYQTLALEELAQPDDTEPVAIVELQRLLRSNEFGRLRPLHVLLDRPPPRGAKLSRVK